MKNRSQTYKSLLGIELNSGRMTAATVISTRQGYSLKNQMSATLTLDPLTHDPELVGQEIRNHLDRMGIHEKRCLVCLPLQWVMCHSIAAPELSPDDEKNYIRLKAEREFPFSADDLSLALSRFKTPDNRPFATIAAIPLNHSLILQKAFKAAKLKPVSMTAGIASMMDPQSHKGTIVLCIKESSAEFMIHAGGGVIVLRRLEYEYHDSEIELEDIHDNILREIRITLGQLAADWNGSIQHVQIFSAEERTVPIIQRIGDSLAELGLKVDAANRAATANVSLPPIGERPDIPLLKTVIRFLETEKTELEFLPPQINRFKELTQRISSKGNLLFGAIAASILFITIAVFAYQSFYLSRLESEWNRIKTQVAQLEDLQQKVKKFRPWFDDSVKSLSILKTLTESFPEDGSVWVKMMEIEDQSIAACAGFAKSSVDLQSMVDKLYENSQVSDFQLDQYQGESPMQYAFNFRWVEGAGNGK